jgi:hypothetical protein
VPTGRAVDKALTGALSFVGRAQLPMPPDVERAHAVPTMNASSIWCGRDRVVVTGGPLPRAQAEAREFGSGDFSETSSSRSSMARRGSVHIEADDDVVIQGELVRLN